MLEEEYQEVQAQLIRRRAEKVPGGTFSYVHTLVLVNDWQTRQALIKLESSINIGKEGFDAVDREVVMSLRYC